MKAIVTSAGTSTAIGLIRALQSEGMQVLATDINAFGYTAGSLIADEFFQVPFATDNGYLDEIARLVGGLRADLLVPVNDAEVEAVAAAREAGRISCACVVPSLDTVRLVRNKSRSTEVARLLGIPCPEDVPVDCSLPRVVRSVVGVGSRGVHFLEASEKASRQMAESIASGDALCQRLLTGDEWTVDVLSDSEGTPFVAIPRKRLEVKAGVATKTVIVQNERLISLARAFCAEVRMPGFSNVQFREDESGVPRFLEANPRFGGCSAASLAACPSLMPAFLATAGIVDGFSVSIGPIAWGSVVTRHYVEVLYAPEP